jgi:hypothetical protein
MDFIFLISKMKKPATLRVWRVKTGVYRAAVSANRRVIAAKSGAFAAGGGGGLGAVAGLVRAFGLWARGALR